MQRMMRPYPVAGIDGELSIPLHLPYRSHWRAGDPVRSPARNTVRRLYLLALSQSVQFAGAAQGERLIAEERVTCPCKSVSFAGAAILVGRDDGWNELIRRCVMRRSVGDRGLMRG